MNQRSITLCDLTSVVIVISPLNSLIDHQVRKLLTTGLRVSVLNIKAKHTDETGDEDVLCDLDLAKKDKLLGGYYNLLFSQPKRCCQVNLAAISSTVHPIKRMFALWLLMKLIAS